MDRSRLARLLALLLFAPGLAGAGPAATSPLSAALDDLIRRGPLADARLGVCVVSLDTGATLYARDADVLLNPASNVKLFTAAAALARLGPEYRFETEVSTDAGGLVGGATRNLYLRGKGDPSLVTERLFALAGDLFHLGLRRIGDLVLDDGWFDGERIGPGFDQEDGDKAYLAPAGALSLNFNTVAVTVAPGDRPGAPARVELEPDSPFFEVSSQARTVGPRGGRRLTIASVAAAGKQRILVEGRVPAGSRPVTSWRKVDDPPLYLGWTLRRLLEARGVRVTGRVRLGPVPADARLLLVAESEPLGEVVRRLNKSSNNFMAEQLLKSLGAVSAGPPGSWPAGAAAVEGFLAEVGIPRGAYVMKNGSGLNDANRFSARQVTRLLVETSRRFPVAAEFLASLPVAGRDGTIRWRLEGTEAVGRMRAKTGTLDGVVSLSGYAETQAHERLAFAVLVNDHPGRSGAVTAAVDLLAAAIVTGGAPSLGPAASSRLPVPITPATTESIGATVRTYLAMGRLGDRRNVHFLRTALRTEGEPAVRLAAAEALFRSDPDGGAARAAFLESVKPVPAAEPLGRVLALAAPGDVTPVLGALGELAAEGQTEPLNRLIELAAGVEDSPSVRGALAAVLADVADAAPDELRAALASATVASRDAAAALLGDRLPGAAGPTAAAPRLGPASGSGSPGR